MPFADGIAELCDQAMTARLLATDIVADGQLCLCDYWQRNYQVADARVSLMGSLKG